MRDYLQDALQTFNGGDWYGWKTHDEDGNKIPNKDRMQYKYIKIIKDGATMPSEADVNAKIQEIKDLKKIIKIQDRIIQLKSLKKYLKILPIRQSKVL